jgi:HTH-type transcriptional regulator / antitoxin HigA
MRSESNINDIYKFLEHSETQSLFDLISKKREEMSLSNLQMSKILDIDKSTFDRLLKKIEDGDSSSIDFFTILKICNLFGIDIQEISEIYASSLKPESIGELEQARKANYIINQFDLKGLKDVGFIESITDFKQIEKRIVDFFRLDSIFQFNSEIGMALFSRTKANSQDKMREFWVRSAFYQFEKINNSNDYNRDNLLAIVPKIRPYTRFEEKGFLTVLQALYNAGVTVIVQSYLSKTQVRGATIAAKNKPCIVITDFNKSYATLWFALLHELYHVLYDFEELKTWKYHLTGENDIYLLREDDADYFAREMLLPKEKLDFVKHIINSPALVAEYAEKNKVHPSIIYSFYCYEEKKQNGKDFYGLYQKYFGKPDKILQMVRTHPWDKESIYQEIEIIKKRLVTHN